MQKAFGVTPNIVVCDVNKTVEFYQNVLGFTLEISEPSTGDYDWASMTCGSTEIMFQSMDEFHKEFPSLNGHSGSGHPLCLYIDVLDLEQYYERISGSTHIIREIGTNKYKNREFAIKDCNGNIVVFVESVV